MAERRFRRRGRYLGIIAAGLGLLAGVGDLCGVDYLTAPIAGGASMPIATAACMAIAGLTLSFACFSPTHRQRLLFARLIQCGSALIAVAGLAAVSWSVLDSGLFATTSLTAPGNAGALAQMSPASALCFCLLGLALLGISQGSPKLQRSSQILAASVATIGLVICLGYLYGSEPLYHFTGHPGMAVNTAIGFLLLGVGTLLAEPERSFMRVVTSEALGGVLCRKTIPWAVAIPIGVGWLRLAGQHRGYYDTEFGLAVYCSANILLFVALIWTNARLVNTVESNRLSLASERADLTARASEASSLAAASTAKFKHLVQSVHDFAISILDLDGRVISWNAGAERFIGYKDDEIIGKSFSMFYPAEDIAAKKPEMIIDQAKAMGRYEDQAWHVRKDGSRFWAFIIINATKDEHGKLTGFAKITRDVTEWKESQDRLQASEERLRSIVNNVVDGILTVDERGTVQSANHAAEVIFGYSLAEMLGQNVKMLMPAPYQAEHDTYLTNYLTTNIRKIIGIGRDVAGRRKNGTVFPMELAVGEFRQGADRFFTGIVRDVTERKAVERELAERTMRDQVALETRVAERTGQLSSANIALQVTVSELKDSREQLRQLSKRLHSLQEDERSRIARELHDELGQMLAVFKIEILRMRNRAGNIPEIVDQAKILMETVDQTIASLRRISSDLRPVVLEQLGIGAALEWLVRDISARTGVRCSLALAGDLTAATGEIATALFRIVQEAITNALKHSGTASIDVRVKSDRHRLVLAVLDYGRGIRETDRERSGSLGLIGMQERALAIGGSITVSTGPVAGTVVEVDVPLP